MTSSEKFEQANKVLEKFNSEVSEFIESKKLTELEPFNKLQDKNIMGDVYRKDQYYYEQITDFKSKYFGISSFLSKLKTETTDRILIRDIDKLVDYVNKKLDMLTTLSFRAQSRVKFYQNIIYLIANMSYGDY